MTEWKEPDWKATYCMNQLYDILGKPKLETVRSVDAGEGW